MPSGSRRHERLKLVLLSSLLFFANALVSQRLFFTEYLTWWGSTDGPFIAISRYAMEHYGDLRWWPLWFGGMPYHSVYCPLFPHLVALGASATRVSPALMFHALAAWFYCMGPVTVFWMAWWFSRSTGWSWFAGLLYSSVSPAAILFPIIRSDVRGWYNLARLYNVVIYGETPHVVALTLIPVAIIAVDAALTRKKLAYYPLAAIVVASIALTSVTGTTGLAMALFAYLAMKPVRELGPNLLRSACIGLMAYGLAMPWYPPSTIRLIVANSEWSLGDHFPFTAWHVLFVGLLLGGAVALNILFLRVRDADSLSFAVLLLLVSAAITLPAFLGMKFAAVPQPLRFRLELEMAVCLTAAFALAHLSAGKVRAVIVAGLTILCAGELVHNRHRAGEIIQAADWKNRIEYREASWFQNNMAGRRVFAPGSVSLWMNVFNDVPQMGGCCDQSIPNFEQRVALFTLYSGLNAGAQDGKISTLWLQAYGVHAVGVSGPGSSEYFLAYSNPRKFDGLLPVLWRDGADIIYGVPQRSDSLAHVIRPAQVISRKPAHGLDVDPLRTYVAALNDPALPLATLQWTGAAAGEIVAEISPGDVISVQVSFDKGWRARVNGVEQRIAEDGLGMMVIYPRCSGSCIVDLSYEDDTEMRIARIVQLASGIACLVCCFLSIRFERALSEP
jgi:hypothetical protein